MFAKRDKHYPSRFGQNSQATAITNFTKPVTKNNFGPITVVKRGKIFFSFMPFPGFINVLFVQQLGWIDSL